MYAMSCVLGLVVCLGFIVAILLGLAYGYNYGIAEYFTLARSDVNVYMKRGQFLDGIGRPDRARRSGGGNVERVDLEPESLRSPEKEAADNDQNEVVQLSGQWGSRDESRKFLDQITVGPVTVSIYTVTDSPGKMTTHNEDRSDTVEIITMPRIQDGTKQLTKAMGKMFAYTYKDVKKPKDSHSRFLDISDNYIENVTPQPLDTTMNRPTRTRGSYIPIEEGEYELIARPPESRRKYFGDVRATEGYEDEEQRRKTQKYPRKPTKRKKYYKDHNSNRAPYAPIILRDDPEETGDY